MIRFIVLCVTVLSLVTTGCRSAPPKENAQIGLVIQKASKDDPGSTSADPELIESVNENDKELVNLGISQSKSIPTELLKISAKLNVLRKNIFMILDRISSINTSNYGRDRMEIIDEIEDALAETRHYLDHEAELIYTIPYLKDEYIDYLVENRIDGIKRVKNIVKLYQMNLQSYYRKLGKVPAAFSPTDTIKHFESSIVLLDEALNLLQLYLERK